ncbi:MAG: YbaB/EbfC family nucleoid-associated protein [Bacillota bacterium]
MGGFNMNKMMKQVQKMQQDIEKLQEEIRQRTVTASSGGGMVQVTVGGDLQVKSLHIQPDAIDPDDPEMLSDMILVAVNEGIRKAQEMLEEEMKKLTGGMNIPSLF